MIVRYWTKMGTHLGDFTAPNIERAIDKATIPSTFPCFAQGAACIQVFQEDGEGHDLKFELSPKGHAWLLIWANEYSKKELNLEGEKFPRVMCYT